MAPEPSIDTELAYESAANIAAAIREGNLSAVETVEYFIARIERYDGAINAVVVRDFERARDAARAADARRSAAQRGGDPLPPLHGVPITVKEAYHLEGLPTTFGYPELASNTATWNADSVNALKGAGAIILGKSNVPLACADFQSYNAIYGTTNNPYDTTRIPGGSSGGSAAALASGFAALEAGSDIGGSIRNPAHYCGVYGHKPTWGVVSTTGHSPMLAPAPETDLVVCGPLARTAEDLALSLDIVTRPHQLSPGIAIDLPSATKHRLADFKVAIWATDAAAPVDDTVAARATRLGDMLREAGATVSDDARPDFDVARSHETYLSLLHSVMAAGVGAEQYARNQQYAARMDPQDRSDRAVTSRAMVLSHADWLRYNARREGLRHAWAAFFRSWDILVCPQMATAAFPHDHSPMSQRVTIVNGQPRPYFEQVFWSGLATASYLPSTVFPTGLNEEGLPIGLQAIGGAFQDRTTLAFAKLLESEAGGFVAPNMDQLTAV